MIQNNAQPVPMVNLYLPMDSVMARPNVVLKTVKFAELKVIINIVKCVLINMFYLLVKIPKVVLSLNVSLKPVLYLTVIL